MIEITPQYYAHAASLFNTLIHLRACRCSSDVQVMSEGDCLSAKSLAPWAGERTIFPRRDPFLSQQGEHDTYHRDSGVQSFWFWIVFMGFYGLLDWTRGFRSIFDVRFGVLIFLSVFIYSSDTLERRSIVFVCIYPRYTNDG